MVMFHSYVGCPEGFFWPSKKIGGTMGYPVFTRIIPKAMTFQGHLHHHFIQVIQVTPRSVASIASWDLPLRTEMSLEIPGTSAEKKGTAIQIENTIGFLRPILGFVLK